MTSKIIKNVFVAGGAGYIGSHVVKQLIDKNYKVIVYDNLEKGHISSLPNSAIFIKGDLSDKDKIDKIFKEYEIGAVMHFANYIEVKESVSNPSKYFKNNIVNGLNLLNSMKDNKVKNIIFSSSAAVYGENESFINENAKKSPKNPYGLSKLIFEQLISEYEKAHGIKFMILRYFNAAGADTDGKRGESHTPETHLIPLVIQTALGKRKNIEIYGTDYKTEDGSCIRDYIHVNDIGRAHILALEALKNGKPSNTYNLGSGKGHSVKEIIKVCEEVSGRKINYVEGKRREGDPAVLIADYNKIKKELGWKPEYNLKEIIKSAWEWHSKHPE
jgi:UDP-glucose 4-epimerase